MDYNIILVRYGEIALKGKNRYIFEDRLIQNIRNQIAEYPEIRINKTYGRIYLELNGVNWEKVATKLRKVFGVVSLSPVIRASLDIDLVKDIALMIIKDRKPATFKINTKRPYKVFPYDTPQINQLIGRFILQNVKELKVDVHNPEVEVNIEVREEGIFIYSQIINGTGGLPLGSSGKGFVLISGGLDSPVAAWLAMKRGIKVELIHFHAYPNTSLAALRKVIDITKVLTQYAGRIKLQLVPFLFIQKEIKNKTLESYHITIMRRFFLRITEKLAEINDAKAIITGDNIGQVASQTLESMQVISSVASLPILRPVITMDKPEIVSFAEKIGTYDISIRPYLDTCAKFVPKSPRTKPTIEATERIENNLNVDYLVEKAINKVRTIWITTNNNLSDQDLLDLILDEEFNE